MFIGHFAVAFAAKKAAPSASLGTLFLAAQLADLVWPVLVLAGIEVVAVSPGITAFTPLDFVSYPYSHSLVALAGWAALFCIVYGLLRHPGRRALIVGAALVLSHWVLDVLTHRPDMPLSIGSPTKLGLGLWDSVAATIIVEGALFAAGVALYCRTTVATGRTGTVSLWTLVGFLAIVYVANIFGPAPPGSSAVAWVALSMWLLVAWGYWVDGQRRPR